VAMNYHRVLIPILALGAVAFLAATLLYWRVALSNICFILALGAWLLVVTRVLLLSLIDATSFPALTVPYLSPAYFMAASGSVLSLAAFLGLFVGPPARKGDFRMTRIDELDIVIHRH